MTNFMASHPAQVTLWGGLVGGPGKPMLQVSHVTCVVQLSSDFGLWSVCRVHQIPVSHLQ